MPVRWKLFRVVCVLQMVMAAVFEIISLINLVMEGGASHLMRSLLFLVIFLLTLLALSILSNNYPDVPVSGRQKANFNRLFLLNFLFLVVLFGMIFSEYRMLASFSTLIDRRFIHLPFRLFVPLLICLLLLVFQLILLYGLYELRRELYSNFARKEFEFEQEKIR